MKTVLVTGVGAIIGYGILRSIRKTRKDIFLIGADIHSDAVGQVWADKFVQAPMTSSETYPDWLERTVIENKVDLVIPGIEQDVHLYAKIRGLFDKLATRVVLNDVHLIHLARDKWLMHQELLNIDSPVRIPSFIEGDFARLSERLGVPFFLKPRCGYASKGLVKVHRERQFLPLADRLGCDLIAQPMIGNDDEEYTVAVFGDGRGRVCASITLRRRLGSDGSTAKAWVQRHDSLDETVAALCAHFKPIGPTNLQFRKDDDGWKLLEINPRISSTTSLRTAFGYNESEMCLDFYLESKRITQPAIRPGFAVRFIEDFVVYDRHHF